MPLRMAAPDGVVSGGSNIPAATAAAGRNDDNNMVDLSQDTSDEEEENVEEEDGIVDLSREEEEEDEDEEEEDEDEEGDTEGNVAVASTAPSSKGSGNGSNVAARPKAIKAEPDAIPSNVASRGNGDDEDEEAEDDLLEEKRSGVSGTGMFRSFKRIFKTGFMAMLDLFDNAVDATMDRPGGYIECQLDPDDDATIIMHNNSDKPIAPIYEILDVNNSSKAEEEVGENGVGVKQACGYLSNLSFVLTKNRKQFSFGILSHELQTDDYPVLPSYVLPDIRDGVSLRSALEDLKNRHSSLEHSVKSWGGGNAEIGLNLLHKKMEMMEKCADEYMFSIVIVKISKDPGQLLDDLRDHLSLYYIHIPDSLSIKINGELLQMRFWERRLVDLTVANLKIAKNEWFYDDPRWQDPIDAYNLRIFVGFDVNRARKKLDSQLSMYIYSRKTGRLIKKERDARHILGLTGSGSTFGAGLTVIVDDINSEFELSPSKQDLVFQDYENEVGENHEKNLYSWIGAWCHHIYRTHEKKFVEKRLLSDKVASLAEIVPKGQLTFSLMDGDFNQMDNITFHILKGTAKIRVHHSVQYTVKFGKDVVRLEAPDPRPKPKARKRGSGSQTPARAAARKSLALTQEDSSSGEEEEVAVGDDRKMPGSRASTRVCKRRISEWDDQDSSTVPFAARSAIEVMDDIEANTGILGSASFENLQLKTQITNLETRNRQLIVDSVRLRDQNNHEMAKLHARLKRSEEHNSLYVQRIQQMENVIAQLQQTISLQSAQQAETQTDPLNQLRELEQEFGVSL